MSTTDRNVIAQFDLIAFHGEPRAERERELHRSRRREQLHPGRLGSSSIVFGGGDNSIHAGAGEDDVEVSRGVGTNFVEVGEGANSAFGGDSDGDATIAGPGDKTVADRRAIVPEQRSAGTATGTSGGPYCSGAWGGA